MAWNTKVISMEAKGQFVLGQPFVTHYRMRGKEIQCLSTATAIQEGRLLELRHGHCIGSGISPDLAVCERITLREIRRKTIVTKDVAIANHGVPWILIPLIWFITRFGKTQEPDKLKLMCEASV